MPVDYTLEQITTLLRASPLVASLQVVLADTVAQRSVYKIRCQPLRPAYQFEVRLIQTAEEFLYPYQLFTDRPVLRWDNAPHFPTLANFPHHFHEEGDKATVSPLGGDPLADLPIVLDRITLYLTS